MDAFLGECQNASCHVVRHRRVRACAADHGVAVVEERDRTAVYGAVRVGVDGGSDRGWTGRTRWRPENRLVCWRYRGGSRRGRSAGSGDVDGPATVERIRFAVSAAAVVDYV